MKLIRQYAPQSGGGNSDKNQKEQKGKDGGQMQKGNRNDNDTNSTGRQKKNQ